MDLFNHEAETFTLAGMLRHPDAYWTINAVGLGSDDFIGTENRKVMRAINTVVSDKKQPDLPLVLEELRFGADDTTAEYAGRLMAMPCSVPQAAEFARTVKGLSTSRKLASVGARIIEIAREKRADSEDAVATAESELRRVREELPVPDRSPDPADILRRVRTQGPVPGIPIRFAPSLHEMSGGLIPGHLWVIGGFSSTGKSAVACNIIADCIAEHRWVGLVSTEMTQENYVQRLLALMANVPFRDVRDRAFFGEQIDRIANAERLLRPAPVRIFDNVYRINDIRLQATKMKETTGLDVLLVDFMQNVRASKGDFSFADMTEITLDLQQMAKDLRITVIAFSQVSNEMAKWDSQGGDDNFYGFKGSGAIKDAADFAIMLKRDRVRQSPILDFHVMKNRHGELRVVSTHIDLPTGRIEEITPEEDFVDGA
jgi:replicative DNA helicase